MQIPRFQGLIFVKQPYFNEPGFEKFQGTGKGEEYSRRYNLHIENATLMYAIMDQYRDSPPYFRQVIKRHFWLKRQAIIKQAERWLDDVSKEMQSGASSDPDCDSSVVDEMFVNPTVQVSKEFTLEF